MDKLVVGHVTGLRHNRPVLLLLALAGLVALTVAGFFTLPAIAALGAFTTIIIGIAAQQSLSNIFAGILISVTRPFKVGDSISGTVGGMSIDGEVSAIGIVYTQVRIEADAIAYLPNGLVMAASVVVR